MSAAGGRRSFSRRRFDTAMLVASVALSVVAVSRALYAQAANERPHIVLIVADDLGWRDVGYHGSEIRTPNIDRLAKEGVRLERFYACPICSPTRAGLMTGRYPIRFGAMRAVIPPWRKYGVPTDEAFIPAVLARAGYEHRGCFGKWHLGHSDIRYHPLSRGFTRFEGHYNGNIDYFTHEREGETDWHVDHEPSDRSGYSTDLIADAAARFIRDHAREGPLLCYVPFNAPHSPLQAPREAVEAYRDLEWKERPASPQRRIYAAMVTRLDDGVGRILRAIDEIGARDRTLVWFLSDNGGTGRFGDNRPLRGHKAEVFEGGVRVAALVRWPAGIPGGRTVMARLAYIDVLPTLMGAAGVTDHGGQPLDGRNVLDVLRGERQEIERPLYHYFGQGGPGRERMALHEGPWKLVVLGPDLSDAGVPDSRRRKLLFRIDRDPYEEQDLAGIEPERVRDMLERLAAFRALQPDDGVPPYGSGRPEGFRPPERWRIPGR